MNDTIPDHAHAKRESDSSYPGCLPVYKYQNGATSNSGSIADQRIRQYEWLTTPISEGNPNFFFFCFWMSVFMQKC